MKKMILLLVFLLLIICTYSFKPVFVDVFLEKDLIFGDMEYSIYCLSLNNVENKHLNVINVGNGYIVKTTPENVSFAKSQVSNILGESVKFKTTFSKIDKIIKKYNIEVFKTEKVGKIYCIYGHANKNEFSNDIVVDGKKVNVQIAFNNGMLTIGSPIILGDY